MLPLLATVLMLFTVGTADAQLGKLFNKAKDAVSGNSASKKSYAEISKPVIPQPEAGAEKIIFTWEKARKQQEAATKTPSSLIHSKQ